MSSSNQPHEAVKPYHSGDQYATPFLRVEHTKALLES
jgi:hypothetical protein